ncbi:MAG: ATP-dependent helicase/nuclease Hef [Pseudomonadota bacterium]|jgi:ERCC4-related helicase
MARHRDAPGQGFLFPDRPERVNKITPVKPHDSWDGDASLPPATPPRREDLPASIDELKTRCALPLLRTDRFEYRIGQVECIYDICSSSENFAVKGSLGSGKTNVALAVSARSLSRGETVLYLTPFDNLVSQTLERASLILSLPPEQLHAIRDDSTPVKRGALYRRELEYTGGHLIIATPGKILNDIVDGTLPPIQRASIKLVIFDECHLAFGGLPYVELMERFRSAGTRLLGFTGTMGKDKEQRGTILENLGVAAIYSIATPPLKRTIFPPRFLALEPSRDEAAQRIQSVTKAILTELTEHLTSIALDFRHAETAEAAALIHKNYLEGPRFSMPVKKGVLAIQADVRRLLDAHRSHGAYYEAASLTHAVDHLHQLHDRLTRFGSYTFLRLAADKLLALNIPDLRDEPRRRTGEESGASRRTVPRYVQLIYRDPDILEAIHTIAADTPFAAVPALKTVPAALRAIPGDKDRSSLEPARLRHRILDDLRTLMAHYDYSDHPKEAAVFSILAKDSGAATRKPTIIFVELVEAARFLVERIHTTRDLDTKAVLCVGAGHDVSLDRAEAISRFDSGEAQVIVATSALEVGQDTQTARRIINFIQTPEAIRLAQRMGRAGRSGAGAEIIDLITKDYEPQYYAGRANLKKMNEP